jgi:arginase
MFIVLALGRPDYTSRVGSPKVAVFGVPSGAGGRSHGIAQAPFRLREAGLLEALRRLERPVVNLSDLSLFPYRDDPDHPRARNTDTATCAIRAAADEMTRALAEGFALVIGGDCSLVVGVLAGARAALGQPVGLVFLDADADLNTPETTPSGYLDGMALALALGRGPREVAFAAGTEASVSPEHVALVGYRALDPGERAPLGDLGLALPAAAVKKLGWRAAAALALDGIENEDGPILVHLDVDVVDPDQMPAKDTLTPGPGLTWDEASDLLTALLASSRVAGLEVCEYNPDLDPGGACARKLIEVVTRAVGRHVRH